MSKVNRRILMRTVIAAVLVPPMFVLSSIQPARACHHIMNWPRNQDNIRLKPEDIVVKATPLRSYTAKSNFAPIAGSNIDVVYKVKIDSVLKQNESTNLQIDQIVLVENPGFICEFYRPWYFKDQEPIENSHEDIRSRIIILRKLEGYWKIVGGEDLPW